jgi:hypothetical protein
MTSTWLKKNWFYLKEASLALDFFGFDFNPCVERIAGSSSDPNRSKKA